MRRCLLIEDIRRIGEWSDSKKKKNVVNERWDYGKWKRAKTRTRSVQDKESNLSRWLKSIR